MRALGLRVGDLRFRLGFRVDIGSSSKPSLYTNSNLKGLGLFSKACVQTLNPEP